MKAFYIKKLLKVYIIGFLINITTIISSQGQNDEYIPFDFTKGNV
jgi:hypothetical protein